MQRDQMKTFKDIISERKQVGTIYHFTKIENLEKLVSKKYQEKLGLDVLEFISYNGHFSTTRNGELASNILTSDKTDSINTSNGYIVRIEIDGDRVSDKYKIRSISSKAKRFKLLPFITRITIKPTTKSDIEKFNELKPVFEEIGIAFEMVRKWNSKHRNLDETYHTML